MLATAVTRETRESREKSILTSFVQLLSWDLAASDSFSSCGCSR